MSAAGLSLEDYSVPDERLRDDKVIRTCITNIRIDSHALREVNSDFSPNGRVDLHTQLAPYSQKAGIEIQCGDPEAENKPRTQHTEFVENDNCVLSAKLVVAQESSSQSSESSLVSSVEGVSTDQPQLYEEGNKLIVEQTIEADLLLPILKLGELMCAKGGDDTIKSVETLLLTEDPWKIAAPAMPPVPPSLERVHQCPRSVEIDSPTTPHTLAVDNATRSMHHPAAAPRSKTSHMGQNDAYGRNTQVDGRRLGQRFLDSYGRPLTEGYDASNYSYLGGFNYLKSFDSAPSMPTESWAESYQPYIENRVGQDYNSRHGELIPIASHIPASPIETDGDTDYLQPPLLICPRPARALNYNKKGVLTGRLTIYGPVNLKWIEQKQNEYRDALPACSVLRREGLEIRRNWGRETMDMYRIYSNNYLR